MSTWPTLPYIESRIQALAVGREALQGHSAVETRRCQEAEQDAEVLTRKLYQVQRNLDAAKEELKRLVEQKSDAAKAIKCAGASVPRLTRRQIEQASEAVRTLVQPHIVVKRALSLVHALLHPEEISAHDPALTSDWEKLSQMLKKIMLQHVPSFKPSDHPLVIHPHVRDLIASQVEEDDLLPDHCKVRPSALLRRAVKRSNLSGPTSARGRRFPFATVAGATLIQQRLADNQGAEQPEPRLSERGVTYACPPVGILFKWLVQQLRFVQALISHEERTELEEKMIKEAEAGVARLLDALRRARVEAEEAKARGNAAQSTLERLSCELGAAQEEERQLCEQRDTLQRTTRRVPGTERG